MLLLEEKPLSPPLKTEDQHDFQKPPIIVAIFLPHRNN